MELVSGNWIPFYSNDVSELFKSLLCANNNTNNTDSNSNCENETDTDMWIEIEYMSGISHSRIPFQRSISVQDIQSTFKTRTDLYSDDQLDQILSEEHVFTSSSTVLLLKILN